MNCLQIPPDNFEAQWPLMLRFLLPAVERSNGRWTPDDVFNELLAGRLQGWALIEDGLLYGAGVTAIHVYPGLRSCMCLWLGGVEAHRWMDLLDETVSAWAIREGCSRMEIAGRKGWERMGSKLGFKPSYVFFEKPLEPPDGYGQHAGDIEEHLFDATPELAGRRMERDAGERAGRSEESR